MGKQSFTIVLLLIFSLLIAGVGLSRGMTVAEAVSFAMEHNRDILTVKQQVEERRARVVEARADAFPQVNLLMSAFRLRDPGFLNSTFGQQILKGGGAGSEFPIPIEAIMPRPQKFYLITMNMQQPLFTWGKVSNAVKLANLGLVDVDLSLEAIRHDVAFQVTGAYYDMLLAEETIAMYEKSLETQKRYLQQTRDYYDVGDATRLDVLRAESQLAATEPGLLQAKNLLVQSRKRLNFVLGRPLDDQISASPVEAEENFSTPDLGTVITTAITNRPDLKQLNIQVEMYDKTIKVFKADFRPRVDLVGNYGYSTIRKDDLFDRNFESWRVAVEIKIPVFDGLKNHGLVGQYESQQAQKELQSQTLAEQIRLDALQSIDACSSAVEVFQARKISLQSAEEAERVSSDQHEQGLATLFELLDSNRRTLEARNEFLNARYDLLRQIAALKRVMGIPVEKLF